MAETTNATALTPEQSNTVKRAARFMASYVADTDCAELARLKNEGSHTSLALLDWHTDALCHATTEPGKVDLTGDDRLEAMERLFDTLRECEQDTQTTDWLFSAYCFFFYLERFARNGRLAAAEEKTRR